MWNIESNKVKQKRVKHQLVPINKKKKLRQNLIASESMVKAHWLNSQFQEKKRKLFLSSGTVYEEDNLSISSLPVLLMLKNQSNVENFSKYHLVT
jgi:hypothetical protein